MKSRRGFLKTLGIGAVAAGPLAAAAAAKGLETSEETVPGASGDVDTSPPNDMETILKAKEDELLKAQTASLALGIAVTDIDRARKMFSQKDINEIVDDRMLKARGRPYDKGVPCPQFISPPSPSTGRSYTYNLPAEPPRFISPRIDFDLGHLEFVANHQGVTNTFSPRIRNEGRDYLYDLMFTSRSIIAPWHVGLIDNAGFTAMSDQDTYDAINQAGNGWHEFTGYYGERPKWPAFTDNAMTFNSHQDATIKGIFICGGQHEASYKGDHGHGSIIWAMSLFDQGDIHVRRGESLVMRQNI